MPLHPLAAHASSLHLCLQVQQLLTYYEKKFRQTYEQDKDMYMK